ncbi:MAG: hypothetical protein FWF02_03430 [Micrococcales bacterium]|nr:hypothetical protein [Micrococcales bacterium]MCL2666740.1 hypothetical protein [Micrococcales bacterium]
MRTIRVRTLALVGAALVASGTLVACSDSSGKSHEASAKPSPAAVDPGGDGIGADGRGSDQEEWCDVLLNSNYEDNAATLGPDGIRAELELLKAAAPDSLKEDLQVLIDNVADEFDPNWESKATPRYLEALEAISTAHGECATAKFEKE